MLFSSMHIHISRHVLTNTAFSAVHILHTAFSNPRHSVACHMLCKLTQDGCIHNSCSSASTQLCIILFMWFLHFLFILHYQCFSVL
jgi:hypothetical protein